MEVKPDIVGLVETKLIKQVKSDLIFLYSKEKKRDDKEERGIGHHSEGQS